VVTNPTLGVRLLEQSERVNKRNEGAPESSGRAVFESSIEMLVASSKVCKELEVGRIENERHNVEENRGRKLGKVVFAQTV
jgi:hypothetical protein